MGVWVFAAVQAVFLAALLVAEWRESQKAISIIKPLTSTTFVVFGGWALSGEIDLAYGVCIGVGLVLSWWGDVLLIPKDKPKIFQLGVLAFGLAHVAYCAAFFALGVDLVSAGIALVPLSIAAAVIWRWLSPNLPGEMRGQVGAYVGIISVMVALSVGAAVSSGIVFVVVGAVVFYLSDLSVARERFVTQSLVNRLWGLPFYFAAQFILVLSVLASR